MTKNDRYANVAFFAALFTIQTHVHAGLGIQKADGSTADCFLQNAENDSLVRMVYAKRGDQKFLFQHMELSEGTITAQLNDGTGEKFKIFGNGSLSFAIFSNEDIAYAENGTPSAKEPARIPLAFQTYTVNVGNWKFHQIEKYNVWTLTGTLIKNDETKFFFPHDWLPPEINDGYKLGFGLGSMDWHHLVNVGQPNALNLDTQTGGDRLSSFVSSFKNGTRAIVGAQPRHEKGENLKNIWCDQVPQMISLFEGEGCTPPSSQSSASSAPTCDASNNDDGFDWVDDNETT